MYASFGIGNYYLSVHIGRAEEDESIAEDSAIDSSDLSAEHERAEDAAHFLGFSRPRASRTGQS